MGASSGIGKATCEILSHYGASVIGSGRNELALENMKSSGSILDYIVADITASGECKRIVDTAANLLGGHLTTVVNAASVLQTGEMDSIDLANYDFNMNCNTRAPFEIMVQSIPFLKAEKCIVHRLKM
jgi:NAD(P)-dependent dehydrogenase (short-subunit alcohol dehydrogenase family)